MNITKEQYEELIDKLGAYDKIKRHPDMILGKEYEKQILIGDCLEKMGMEFCEATPHKSTTKGYRLAELWHNCGFSKSLQTIVEESGWEIKRTKNHQNGCCFMDNLSESKCDCGASWVTTEEKLKSPEANELLSYLYKLFITK